MKGIFYSVMIALFLISFLALIIFYSQTQTTNIDINIRANELEYFSKSIEKDLTRFLEIHGKRALISAVSKIVVNGTGLDDAQIRLNEMIQNGTLYGEPVPLVDTSNLQTWKLNISKIASAVGFNVEFKNIEINITQNDSFNVLFVAKVYVNISDGTINIGILKNITSYALVSIEGIEDPIYPLKTYGRVIRFIKMSNVSKTTNSIVSGENASGFVSGYAFVKSDFQVSDINSSQILVTNSVAGKETIAAGFAGVVSESDIIIPPQLIGKAVTGATNAMNLIKNGTKIYLDETTKKVWDLSNLTLDIKNGYYHSSDEGASFLDRLEGNLTLSPKYQYGLESFVYLPDLTNANIPINSQLSVLDYQYWRNIAGNSIRNGNYDSVYAWFKIDSQCANLYGISELI
ncbi:MAG: hypothetical protein QXD43_01165 [Candidatus Aenigmatarchaeota archaeon]